MKKLFYLFLITTFFTASLWSQEHLQSQSSGKKIIVPVKNISESTLAQLNQVSTLHFSKDFGRIKTPLSGFAPTYALIDLDGTEVKETFTSTPEGWMLTDVTEKKINGVWVMTNRQAYEYDQNGNVLKFIYEQVGEYNSKEVIYYEYNSSDDLIKQTIYNVVGGVESAMERYLFTYNAQHQILTQISQNMELGQWKNSWRNTSNYDTNGDLSRQLFENADGESWKNEGLYLYEYDANRNNSKFSYQYWENNAWVYMFRDEHTFDANGNQISRKKYYWDDSVFIHVQRDFSTYDSHNQLTSWWNEFLVDNAWVGVHRISNTYLTKGVMSQSLSEIWMGVGWMNASKVQYGNDGLGNAITGDAFSWDNANSQWVPSNSGFTFLYNYGEDELYFNGTTVDLFFRPLSAEENVNSPVEFTLGQNYPNPFNPSTSITFTLPSSENVTLTVYNSLGAEVSKLLNGNYSAGEHKVSFDASGLESGVYFYTLRAGDFTQTQKMLFLK